jgi:hypothetical protein
MGALAGHNQIERDEDVGEPRPGTVGLLFKVGAFSEEKRAVCDYKQVKSPKDSGDMAVPFDWSWYMGIRSLLSDVSRDRRSEVGNP